MPRIRFHHEGRFRSANRELGARQIRAGRHMNPAPVAGGKFPAPVAGGKFPAPVAGGRIPAPEAGGKLPARVA